MKNKKGVRVFAAILSTTLLGSIALNKNDDYVKVLESHTIESHDPDYKFVAHRGFSSFEVENSKEAIISANNLPCASAIEVDVRLTSDENLVLSHDDNLSKISDSTLEVSSSTYSELSQVPLLPRKPNYSFKTLFNLENKVKIKRLENKTGTITSLDETLEVLSPEKTLFIELKFENNYEKLSRKVVDVLKKYPQKKFIIQAFEYEELKRMMEEYPEYTYQLIIKDKNNLKYLDEDFDAYGLKHTIIDSDMVISILEDGKEVSLWTINSPHTFKKITDELGSYADEVNYITDNPDILCYSAKSRVKQKERRY